MDHGLAFMKGIVRRKGEQMIGSDRMDFDRRGALRAKTVVNCGTHLTMSEVPLAQHAMSPYLPAEQAPQCSKAQFVPGLAAEAWQQRPEVGLSPSGSAGSDHIEK